MNKLVIFDCDGVLVDSEMILNRFDAEALTAAGYPITAEECIRRFTGLNMKSVLRMIFDESGIEISADYFSDKHALVKEAFKSELQPLIAPVLGSLHTSNISRCVASSSPRERVIECLEITRQHTYFNESSIFTSQQVVRGKPAPDLFLFAADQMGFNKENCIVVEDSPAGIEAAQEAGMQAIAFLGGTHTLHDWYQKRINTYNIPIAENADQLQRLLDKYLVKK